VKKRLKTAAQALEGVGLEAGSAMHYALLGSAQHFDDHPGGGQRALVMANASSKRFPYLFQDRQGRDEEGALESSLGLGLFQSCTDSSDARYNEIAGGLGALVNGLLVLQVNRLHCASYLSAFSKCCPDSDAGG